MPIVNSLKLLENDRQELLDVRLMGNLDDHNRKMMRDSGLTCLNHDGFVSPDESYRRQRNADILISIDHVSESELDKVYLPSKIQDYMAARRFILAITSKGSAVHNVVGSKYGVCFDHRDNRHLQKFWIGLTNSFLKRIMAFSHFRH